jgi:type III restriction enzyme
MKDIVEFKHKDITLSVSEDIDPAVLPLSQWEPFLDALCEGRPYQKKAIKACVRFLAGKKYASLNALALENFRHAPSSKKDVLLDVYKSEKGFLDKLNRTSKKKSGSDSPDSEAAATPLLADKLFANVDLATGTGKSYVMFGVAQIMLGLGLVDKVLVLCPSVPIEEGLLEKFQSLVKMTGLMAKIPEDAVYREPAIKTAYSDVIESGDIGVENIQAIYTSSSSIEDSFGGGKGATALVLNDESHHIFGSDNTGRQWSKFLLNPGYSFKYMLGFTGTAYIGNEYFPDVLYRYSLKDAIEQRVVKNVEYITGGATKTRDEKFQVISANHAQVKLRYPKLKPLTVFVTKDVAAAKALREEFASFLASKRGRPATEEKRAMLVATHDMSDPDRELLREVDEPSNPVEWIFAVSMLNEGWDVKNVFQIVPMEERAFNSKLLISQVLGRGLRVPEGLRGAPQPKVMVINHNAWGAKIAELVSEILEIESRIEIQSLGEGAARHKHHFTLHNVDYSREERRAPARGDEEEQIKFDFTATERDGISLESTSITRNETFAFESVLAEPGDDDTLRMQDYELTQAAWTIDEVLDKLLNETLYRALEKKVLKLGDDTFTRENMPGRDRLRKIIEKSMSNRSLDGESMTEKNAQAILSSFSVMLRGHTRSGISFESVHTQIKPISTTDLGKETWGIGNFRKSERGFSLFHTGNFQNEVASDEQSKIVTAFLADDSFPKSATKQTNEFQLKTPTNFVISTSTPERLFLEHLCEEKNAKNVSAWIKSKSTGFYSVEYSYRTGTDASRSREYKVGQFNIDFFIKVERTKNGKPVTYILVVDIKEDKDDCTENRAKYRGGKEHFALLNDMLAADGEAVEYVFHILSPSGFCDFFTYLSNGKLFEAQSTFRCELENLLEASKTN